MEGNVITVSPDQRIRRQNKVRWGIFVCLSVMVGIYPLFYLLEAFRLHGFLSTKPIDLRQSTWYMFLFYTHIAFGGLSLLIGWSQFSVRFRKHYLETHRFIGKVYVVSVLLSSLAGLVIALFATGGTISIVGFAGLAICWLFSNIKAYTFIRKGRIQEHQEWMIRNYALTFAAVTLRIWLPIAQGILSINFVDAYRVIAWMCWVPNLLVAELIIKRKGLKTDAQLRTA